MSVTTNVEKITTTIQEFEVIVAQWELKVDRLEEEIKPLQRETQAAYQEQVDNLRELLHKAQVRLRAMAEGDPKEWVMGRPEFEEKFEAFRAAFMQTTNRLQNEDEEVSLGWLQGFSNERTQASAGWGEGMGEPSVGSEGWVEGMGEREHDSEGWVEGYERG